MKICPQLVSFVCEYIYICIKALITQNNIIYRVNSVKYRRIELLILPCLVLSLLANYRFDIVEVFWAFSVYLESVAIIPQLYFISRAKHVENAVYYYIAVLSWYKVFHLIEGVYRFYSNEPYDRISLAAGVVQLMFYCDFFMRDVPLKGDVRGEVDEEAAGVSQEDKDKDDRRKAKEEEAMRSAAEYLQQQQQEQQQAENENEAEKHNNLREVVLTPAALTSEDEKVLTYLFAGASVFKFYLQNDKYVVCISSRGTKKSHLSKMARRRKASIARKKPKMCPYYGLFRAKLAFLRPSWEIGFSSYRATIYMWNS